MTRGDRDRNDRPVVSVVVPARQAASTLPRTLAALANQRLAVPYEVVIVDDGSTDETPEIARGAPIAQLVLLNGVGPSRARNAGVAAARGSVLAFTDADCFPTSGWLAAALRALDNADLVQGAVHPDPTATFAPFDRSLWVYEETGRFEAANIVVRRDLFERIGGFEDWTGLEPGRAFGEDIWFGWRARRRGARTAFCEDALVHHAVFKRSPLAYVAERARYRHFAGACAHVPELRRHFFAHYFLNKGSAAFDAALAGAALRAAGARRLGPLLVAPYAWRVLRNAVPWRRRAPLVAAVSLAADAVAFASLVTGSVRWRTPLV